MCLNQMNIRLIGRRNAGPFRVPRTLAPRRRPISGGLTGKLASPRGGGSYAGTLPALSSAASRSPFDGLSRQGPASGAATPSAAFAAS